MAENNSSAPLKTAPMIEAFEAAYSRDWNDPAGDEIKEIWHRAWQAAVAAQAAPAAEPLPLLVRDIARDLGITPLDACQALKGLGNFSLNSAVTADMARKLRECFPEATEDSSAGDQLAALIEGMSVSVDVSTGDHDAGHRYFGTVTEVMEDAGEKHGVTLLVQDAKPNFEHPVAKVQAEPVMIYHGRCTIDCGEHGHHDVEMLKMIPAGAKLYTAPQAQSAFQQRVQPWMMECFGAEIAADRIERNHRFLEEALELVQATGCTKYEAFKLVNYVFKRPVGKPAQEVGGVMVTLAAHCLANGLDMQACAETELERIWTKVPEIRAKQAAKPKHSPLPMAQRADPLDEISEALHDYHYALDTRQHGGVAAGAAINAIEEVLDMHWQQGQETGRRAAMAAAQEGGNAAKEA